MKRLLFLACIMFCLIPVVFMSVIYRAQEWAWSPSGLMVTGLSAAAAWMLFFFWMFLEYQESSGQDRLSEDSVTDSASDPGMGFPMATARNVAIVLKMKDVASATPKKKWKLRKRGY